MSEDTTTQCLLFSDIFPKPVAVEFDQRQGSSDGGAILLKAADRRLGLIDALAVCWVDPRQAGKVEHEREELLAQRVYGMACGYADAHDAARLGQDPVSTSCCWGETRSRVPTWLRNPLCRGSRIPLTASSSIAWQKRWPTA